MQIDLGARTHQDIRPQNILLCGDPSDDDYSVPFKFADMGTAHIRKVKNEGINRPAVDQYGNGMYSMFTGENLHYHDFELTVIQVPLKLIEIMVSPRVSVTKATYTPLAGS